MKGEGRSAQPILGCHLSIGKGFAASIGAAEELGNNALQIFSHNASAWRMKPIGEASLQYVVIHTMYLLNLASPDDSLFERSVAALIEEIARAVVLGVDRVVTHLGAHVGGGIEAGIGRVIEGLERVIASPAFSSAPSRSEPDRGMPRHLPCLRCRLRSSHPKSGR